MKWTTDYIFESLSAIDLGCVWLGILKPKYLNKIGFDNDIRGNGDGPWLELICCKDYVKFSGTHLTKEEKKLVFPYGDFNEIDDFTDYIGDFIREYFNSIKTQNIRIKYSTPNAKIRIVNDETGKKTKWVKMKKINERN